MSLYSKDIIPYNKGVVCMQVIYLLHVGYAYTDYPPVTTYVPV